MAGYSVTRTGASPEGDLVDMELAQEHDNVRYALEDPNPEHRQIIELMYATHSFQKAISGSAR